jgi:Protein of unknown function (DUF3551)
MRVTALASLVVLTIGTLAIGTLTATSPVHAQIYDPNYPVCLHVFGPATYYECRYWSLPQCAMSASGRGAQCVVNPYAANAYQEPPVRHHRRYRHVY